MIHAPHHTHGLNLCRPDLARKNRNLLDQAKQYAELLDADKIIVHPGVGTDLEESCRQLRENSDERILVENMPYWGLNGMPCLGATLDALKRLISASRGGFCLDIGHAIKSAASRELDVYSELERFMGLKPEVVHIMDGESSNRFDEHLHLGDGDYHWPKIKTALSENGLLNARFTVETPKEETTFRDDFLADVHFFRALIHEQGQAGPLPPA